MEIYLTVAAWIKVIAGYLTIVLLGLLVWVIFHAFRMVRAQDKALLHVLDKPETEEEAEAMYMDDWGQIKQFANSMQEAEWKLAVIQADKLVDEMLKVQGFQGESMGERLMSIDPNRYLTLQELWEAHKLRNLLVHDISRSISKGQAVAAVESYERFLMELGFFE